MGLLFSFGNQALDQQEVQDLPEYKQYEGSYKDTLYMPYGESISSIGCSITSISIFEKSRLKLLIILGSQW